MSFLEEITKKKKNLKSCDTVVTVLDGRKYLEVKGELGKLELIKLPETSHGFVVDEKLDLQIAKILDYLYLSSQDVAQDFDLLKKHNITHILSIGVCLPIIDFNKIKVKSVELLDEPTADITKVLTSCFDFIDSAVLANKNSKILVHCNAGYSRAPAVVIAYLMTKYGLSYDESFKKVNEKRNIRPNIGFINKIKNLQKNV